MKLKKSLVALAAASSLAFAGTTAAVAAEDTNAPAATASSTDQLSGENGSSTDQLSGENGSSVSDLGSSNNEGGVSGSLNKAMGWKVEGDVNAKGEPVEPTGLVQKIKDIAALFGVIVTIVGGIVTLSNSVDKLAKLAR